jgi:AcrR family transcriptional regulator
MPNGDMLSLMNKAKTEIPSSSETGHAPGIIWAREPRRKQGQHPPLSREHIVRAAIDLADAEGIQALSFRRMAAKLGVSTMALYWYVESKEDVLDLMVDAVYAEMAFSQPSSGSWRTDCMMLATQVRKVMRSHPWLASLSSNRPLLGPNALKLHECVLTTLSALALDKSMTLAIAEMIGVYVRGFVQKELGEAEARRRSGLSEDEWRVSVAPYIQKQVIESTDYPSLAQFFLHAQEWDDDKRFTFGLTCLLDGVVTQVLQARGKEQDQ